MAWTDEFDRHFCVVGKKYDVKKLILKAVAITESSLDPKAYRYEPAFWDRYLKDKPEWKDKDPKLVSASHGLMQLMWPTATMLGFSGTTAEDLQDPLTNIMLGAKLIRRLLDKSIAERYSDKFYWLSPLQIALAQFNGGKTKNPADDGSLRNQKYVRRVMITWGNLRQTEKECDEV